MLIEAKRWYSEMLSTTMTRSNPFDQLIYWMSKSLNYWKKCRTVCWHFFTAQQYMALCIWHADDCILLKGKQLIRVQANKSKRDVDSIDLFHNCKKKNPFHWKCGQCFVWRTCVFAVSLFLSRLQIPYLYYWMWIYFYFYFYFLFMFLKAQ